MKKLMAFLLAALLVLGAAGSGRAESAADQAAASWRLEGLGVVGGRGGRPELYSPFTRAEVVTILVRAFGRQGEAEERKGEAAFSDTASHWARGQVAVAKDLALANGFSLGFGDGTFRPDARVTNAELLAFVLKFLGVAPDPTKAWPENVLASAVACGLLKADDLPQIRPAEPATLGRFYYVLDRAFYGFKLPDGKTVYTKYVKPLPPLLSLDAPAFDGHRLVVTGTVSGDTTTLAVNGAPVQPEDGCFRYVLADAAGTKTVTVAAGDLAGHVVARTLRKAPVGFVPVVDVPASVTVQAGETVDLPVAVRDPLGNVDTAAAVAARSDQGAWEGGKFTAGPKAGSGYVEVASGDWKAIVPVVVTPGPAARLVISPAAATLKHGESVGFRATLLDRFGNVITLPGGIVWTSDQGCLEENGFFRACPWLSGNVTITAVSGPLWGEASVTIAEP